MVRSLVALLLVATAVAAVARAAPSPGFVVTGRVYCDNCRAGFETNVSHAIEGEPICFRLYRSATSLCMPFNCYVSMHMHLRERGDQIKTMRTCMQARRWRWSAVTSSRRRSTTRRRRRRTPAGGTGWRSAATTRTRSARCCCSRAPRRTAPRSSAPATAAASRSPATTASGRAASDTPTPSPSSARSLSATVASSFALTTSSTRRPRIPKRHFVFFLISSSIAHLFD
jgi:hypothetical protein